MARQLGFDLPTKPALGRESFFVSPANAVAVASLEDWHSWPQGKLVLTGPQGAGKTHLAQVWATETGAPLVAARDLSALDLPGLAEAGCVAVEDVPQIAGDPAAEEALFHLHNLLAEAGGALLLTAETAPTRWGLSLPDLASRMEGTSVVALTAPDDALLAAVLAKLFADRQLEPTAKVIPYLLGRMERTFAAAGRIVAEMDREALAARRKITRSLAREVLDKLSPPDA